MGKIYEEIDERLAAFLSAQKMFFVATAPLSPEGHLNLFPARPGARTIVRVRLDRIADSFGYALPLYHYEGERTQLDEGRGAKGRKASSSTEPRTTRRASTACPGS